METRFLLCFRVQVLLISQDDVVSYADLKEKKTKFNFYNLPKRSIPSPLYSQKTNFRYRF